MEEMAAILAHLPIEILTLDSYPEIGDIPETGKRLKDNAFIKAQTVHDFTGLPALADDTGLEVDALDGAPGVFSARYSGENCSYADNVNKVLIEMNDIDISLREATFKTVVTYVSKDLELVAEGSVKGSIT